MQRPRHADHRVEPGTKRQSADPHVPVRRATRRGRGAAGRDARAAGGGVFLNGEQQLRQPGADGLVNTADDAAAGPEELPGANGRFEAGPLRSRRRPGMTTSR